MQILTKVTEHHGKNWDLEVPSALWSYQTSVKTSTGFTPFRLVFGKEALLPVDLKIPALKMLEKVVGHLEDALTERLSQLQKAQLDRMSALDHFSKMQERALERINKKIKKKGISKGDLVLRYNSKLDNTFHKKFQIKWEGPFKVETCFPNGSYQLVNLDGNLHASRVNGLCLKLYHARLMTVTVDEENEEGEAVPAKNASLSDEEGAQMLFATTDHE